MSEAINEAVAKGEELESKINDFFAKIDDVLDWVPGFLDYLIKPIQDGLQNLRTKVAEFWEKVKEFLENTGNPDKLKSYADRWREQVGNPIGEIAESISKDKLETNTEWSGSGAAAYKAVLPAQKDGLDKVKDISVDFSDTLKELANGIENFWISIGIAFGSAVVGLAGAIVEAATVVAIPGAIATAIGAVGVAAGFIGKAIVDLKAICDTIDTSQDTIKQGVIDLGDEWSKAKPVNQEKMDDEQQWEPM